MPAEQPGCCHCGAHTQRAQTVSKATLLSHGRSQALGSWTPGMEEGLEVAVTIKNVQPQWPAQWPKEAITVVLNLHFQDN